MLRGIGAIRWLKHVLLHAKCNHVVRNGINKSFQMGLLESSAWLGEVPLAIVSGADSVRIIYISKLSLKTP